MWGEPTPEQMEDLIALTTRPYRKRYAGLLRQIARNNGLHPIRDRDLIYRLLSRASVQAKQIKRQNPKPKYRNMKINVTQMSPNEIAMSVEVQWRTAGPLM